MAVDVAQSFTDLQKTWHETKSLLTEQQAEIKKQGDAAVETKKALDDLNARYDQLDVLIQKKLRDITMAGVRDGIREAKERSPEYKAYTDMLRFGWDRLEPEQKDALNKRRASKDELKGQYRDIEGKVLQLGDATLGGYLAPPEFVDQIVKTIVQYSPIRNYANVRQTSNRTTQIPVRKNTFAATWVSEIGTRSETTGLKYSLDEITPSELYADVYVSLQELEDAAFDLEAEIQMEAALQFAKAEGTAFLNGTGQGQPFGILTDANFTTKNNGNSTTLQYAGIVDFIHGIKTEYAATSNLYMLRATMGAVRKIVDSQSRPLWEPSMAPGNPSTILGIPVVEMVDMPTVASGNVPILLGDLKRGYTIVDRVQMVTQVLREKYAESGQVAYLVRKRVGGQLVLSEAVLGLKMA